MEWRDCVLVDEGGRAIARVEPAGDGRRWCAVVRGRRLVTAGRIGRLLTWETAEGARAGVLRELRHPRVERVAGATFAGADCPRCGFIHCSCLRELRAGDPADLFGDDVDDDGDPDGDEREPGRD